LRRLRDTGMLGGILENECRIAYVQEPVELWRAKGWLGAFYADPTENGFPFQLLVLTTHIAAVRAVLQAEALSTSPLPLVMVVERSCFDQNLFWQAQVDLGRTSDIQVDAYDNVWKEWRHFVPEPRLIVLFYTSDMQYVMERLQARARPEETCSTSSSSESEQGRNMLLSSAIEIPILKVGGLTVEYQELLFEKHCQWFASPTAHPPRMLDGQEDGIPCVHINVDAPFHVSDGSLRELADELAAAIRTVLY
jgi:deoxyadenosine/deoxycytidine kinase